MTDVQHEKPSSQVPRTPRTEMGISFEDWVSLTEAFTEQIRLLRSGDVAARPEAIRLARRLDAVNRETEGAQRPSRGLRGPLDAATPTAMHDGNVRRAWWGFRYGTLQLLHAMRSLWRDLHHAQSS